MRVYEMQVKINEEWKSVHYGDGEKYPYQYETRGEALKMLRVCYPSSMIPSDMETRVVEVLV